MVEARFKMEVMFMQNKVLVEKKVKSNLPIAMIGVAWIVYACFFPLYRWSHLFIAAIFSVLVYYLFRKLIPDRVITVEQVVDTFESSGDAAADEIVEQGKEYLEKIEAVNALIEDKDITERLKELVDIWEKIFASVVKSPAKAPQTRKFMQYYLPTTLKMLETYARMEHQNTDGEATKNTRERIQDALVFINKASVNQLDNMFKSEMLDVSTDIDVLETMLKNDGII